ncbi:MAG: hypothetical protein R3A80_13975 [Bdellovibrionota bacterium]
MLCQIYNQKALKSGEISCKEKTQKLQHQEYVKGVVGLAYVVAANIFNSSPSIKNAVVSGYTQRRNKKTGQMEDQYVYSVCFNVDKFRVLNFQYIDPLEALTNFSFRIDERSNGELKAIAPFGTSDLKSVA